MIYTGAVTEVTPTPMPTRRRPSMRIYASGAAVITTDPRVKTTSALSVAFLRPRTSLIQPPVAARIIAPPTSAMLTIVS